MGDALPLLSTATAPPLRLCPRCPARNRRPARTRADRQWRRIPGAEPDALVASGRCLADPLRLVERATRMGLAFSAWEIGEPHSGRQGLARGSVRGYGQGVLSRPLTIVAQRCATPVALHAGPLGALHPQVQDPAPGGSQGAPIVLPRHCPHLLRYGRPLLRDCRGPYDHRGANLPPDLLAASLGQQDQGR